MGRLRRYPQAEKLEIIRWVETSDLPAKRTLEALDIPRSTFYRWYTRYLRRGEAGLADQKTGRQHFCTQAAPAGRGGSTGTAERPAR